MATFKTEKEFTEQLNDIIAPMTRAWERPIVGEIEKVTVRGVEQGNPDEITVHVALRLSRKNQGRINVGDTKLP